MSTQSHATAVPWDYTDQTGMTRPPWRRLLIEQSLRRAAARRPNGEAIRFGGQTTTWSELDAMADRAANGLLAFVGKPGDVVALKAANEPQTLAMMYGIARAGMAIMPINPMSTEAEIGFQMGQANVAALLSPDGLSVPEVIARGHDGVPDVYVEEDSPFWYRFTGGTTGSPKCFRNSQRSMFLLLHEMALALRYRSDDRVLINAPLAHAAFAFAAVSVIAGATMVIKPQFSPQTLWLECDDDDVTQLFLVPSMAMMARQSPGEGSSIRQIVLAASPLPRAIKEELMSRFPQADIAEMFGSSEIGMITMLRGWEHDRHAGSIGLAGFGNEVRILDDSGNELPPGEIGTIYVHGPGMSDGFTGSVQAAEGTVRDGWVTAGDMAHRDSDGYLFLADRRSDLIITGGLNVYPAEVENVLLQHGGLTDVVVVGVPDEQWGQLVVALVVGDADHDSLDAHCRKLLAGYKIPRRYITAASVPKSPAGKILRRVVRDQINEETGERDARN